MQPQEIDIALDELETRLDRLRSLYEQYFLGIEKIEPAVARKDVDRRFWILRRLQIRNTARRFRLQTVVQRYNTFQQYWTRICREIENGTYVRHLLKAQKNLGAEPKTWAAKKRLGYFRRGAAAEGAEGGAPTDSNDPDLGGLLDSGADLAHVAENAAAEALSNAGRAEQARAAATSKARKFEDLGPLDLDFDDAPSVPPPSVKPPLPIRGTKPNATRPELPKRPATPLADRPATAARLAEKPSNTAPAVPARPAPVSLTPRLAPPGSMPATPSTPGAAASMPGPASSRPDDKNRLGTAPPIVSRPPPNAAVPSISARPASTGLSDERLRQLHAELVATRRQLKQADNVSMDSLAKSLRDTETKLLAQHHGRTVDFQVVVKDGRPVVKPVVRK